MAISLVTGGAGFMGRHLVHQLLQRNQQVRVLDIAQMDSVFPPEVAIFQGSILDEALLTKAMKGIDYLFHLAANPHLWSPDKSAFYHVNYEGTKKILESAVKHEVQRIIYTSSETLLKSYRWKNKETVSEASSMPALEELPGPYSRSKMLADQEARKAAEAGLPVTIVYPTTPVGPGDVNLTPPTRMIMDFVNGKNPAYLDCVLNYIAVEDAALGHVLAAEKGKIGERYIIGNQNLWLSEVLNILEQASSKPMPRWRIPYQVALHSARISELIADHLTKKPPRASVEGVLLAGTHLTFDVSKARRELGLPENAIDDAFLRAVGWLQQQGHIK